MLVATESRVKKINGYSSNLTLCGARVFHSTQLKTKAVM
jgi:hypothetical protein